MVRRVAPFSSSEDCKDCTPKSASRSCYNEGWSKQYQARVIATPAAGEKGGKKAEKGVDPSQPGAKNASDDMRDVLQPSTVPVGQPPQIGTTYDSTYAPQALLRYHKRLQGTRQMTQEQREARWQKSLHRWQPRWHEGRSNAKTQTTVTDFSLLPAGKRAQAQHRDEVPQKEKPQQQQQQQQLQEPQQQQQETGEVLEAALGSKKLATQQPTGDTYRAQGSKKLAQYIANAFKGQAESKHQNVGKGHSEAYNVVMSFLNKHRSARDAYATMRHNEALQPDRKSVV